MCTEIVSDIQNSFCTQYVLPMFFKKESFWQRFTCTQTFIYMTSGLRFKASKIWFIFFYIFYFLPKQGRSRQLRTKNDFDTECPFLTYGENVWRFEFKNIELGERLLFVVLATFLDLVKNPKSWLREWSFLILDPI